MHLYQLPDEPPEPSTMDGSLGAPWTVVRSYDDWFSVCTYAEQHPICTMTKFSPEHDAAIASLISAAPSPARGCT
jgi:hypothetical protein